MALRYWVAGGTGNWNSTTNWSTSSGGASGASVPTASDDAVFNASSGAGTAIINVATAAVISINFTGFTGTLEVNNTLSAVSATLGTGMSFSTNSGTPILRLAGTGTYTSNGVTWPYTVDTGLGTQTITFSGNATVQNFNRRTASTSQLTLNGNTLTINGDFSATGTGTNNTIGTTNIVLAGTGTWSQASTGTWRNNLTINTSGTITISSNVHYDTGTLTYTAGTVTTTDSTLTIAANTTLNTNGMSWNNISISGTTTITLSNNLDINGNLSMSGTTTLTSNTITIAGDLTVTGTGIISGTASITLDGTGTWSHTSTGPIRNNLTINTSGTITIGTNIYYNTGTLTYTTGTVTTTNSTLIIGASTTLNTNGITWNNITFTGTVTLTLSSNLTLTGTFTIQNNNSSLTITLGGNSLVSTNANLALGTSCTFNLPANQTFKSFTNNATNSTLNNNTLTLTENITLLTQVSGTSSIVYAGTGTWTATATAATINNNFTINTAGTLTITGNVYKTGGTFTYTAGTISDTLGAVITGNATTCNVSGVTWTKFLVGGTTTLTSNINAITFGTALGNAISFTLGGNSLNFTHLELGNTSTTTLPTAWVCTDLTVVANSAFTLNTNSITINGNLSQNGNGTSGGTTTLTYAGTGTWSQTGTSYFTNSFTINTAGTLTFTGGNIGGGVFTYTAGTVNAQVGSTLFIRTTSTTINGIINWYDVILGNSEGSGAVASLILNAKLTCTNSLILGISNTVFSGTDGTFDTYDLILGTEASVLRTTQLVSTKTYRVRRSLTCTQATNAARILLRSTTPSSKAIFTVDNGSTIDVGFVNATDINSSLGRTIYSYRGVFTNTDNWALLPTDVTPNETSHVFVN
jgi:hypothetical protein